MRQSVSDSKRFSDRFLPEIKRHIGEALIGESPAEMDMTENTDLIVLKLDAVRIACRIRRHEYLSRYGHQFTIRSGRPSGMKTELAKIIEGFGDYMFYGFAAPEDKCLSQWFLGSLNVFRLWLAQTGWRGGSPYEELVNHDNSSSFRAFDLSLMPHGFVVSSSGIPGVSSGVD